MVYGTGLNSNETADTHTVTFFNAEPNSDVRHGADGSTEATIAGKTWCTST